MNETRKLAQFASQITYDKLPKDVIAKAKELVLDQLGCELAGSTLPWSKLTFKYVNGNRSGKKESTVLNYGLKTNSLDAAFANASFGRSIEADEIDQVSKCHLSSVLVPAALATAEKQKASGQDLIKALVVGYDIASRVATSVITMMLRGFYPTTIAGPLGAAAAAGVLMGFSEDEILYALSIAASHASGLLEFSETGGSVNKIYGGMGALNGLKAASLVQAGFTGPVTILEGNKGFCKAFANEYFLDQITDGLGKEYRIMGIGFRQYCCCGTQGAALDAVSKMLEEHNISPAKIREIIVRAPKSVLRMVGSVVEPTDVTSAQYSGRFGIALMLIKGVKDFNREYFNETNLRNRDILDLIKKTEYVFDEELDKVPPGRNPTKIIIKFSDGSTCEEQVDAPRGLTQNPMTKEERLNKFRKFASLVFPDDKIEQIIEIVRELEYLDTIGKLSSALVAR